MGEASFHTMIGPKGEPWRISVEFRGQTFPELCEAFEWIRGEPVVRLVPWGLGLDFDDGLPETIIAFPLESPHLESVFKAIWYGYCLERIQDPGG